MFEEILNKKKYLCLFTIEGHLTWRTTGVVKNIEDADKILKNGIGKAKVTAKKFFELDLIAGTFEEF